MRFEIETAGQTRAIDVGPSEGGPAGGWHVMIDGRSWEASLVAGGSGWSLHLRPLGEAAPAACRSYDVMFEPSAPGRWVVHVDGRAVEAALSTVARRQGRHGGDGGAEGRLVAPMPGRVVKVLVTVGSTVEARQGCVVIEAMKMENELRAPRAGVVREIRVAEGASVDAHAVLVVIE